MNHETDTVVHAADPHWWQGRLKPTPLDSAFAALADPTRRATVEALRRGPQRAGDLARQLGSTPAGLSRHLRILRESGLVTEEASDDDARVRLLRLERKPFDALRAWVDDVEAFWAARGGRPKSGKDRRESSRS